MMVLLRLIFLFAAIVVLSVPPDAAAGDKDKDRNASYLPAAERFARSDIVEQRELSQKLTGPGAIKVKCDVHDWMSAYIVLLKDQPYYAVTGERGQFTIAGVPAGSYTLRAWHEALGTMEKPVTVTASQTAEIDFIIKPKARAGKNL